MKILINYNQSSIGHQILDAWHARVQSQSENYLNNTEYSFEKVESVSDYHTKILCDYMPQSLESIDLNKYDLVLLCNGGEPIEVASPLIKSLLQQDKVYLICNSLLTDDHPLQHKIIWFPDSVQTCRDYWTRHFYPQYFEHQQLVDLPRHKNITCINGSNRINRKYFFDCLQQVVPELTPVSNINPVAHELLDCQWESVEDTEFRQWLNDNHPVIKNHSMDENYYSQSSAIGIQEKFGLIPPGYFVLPMYYESRCVVYPETSWINNELCLTEKACKCFFGGSLPMPIAGANVNKLYNDIGFATAWNLLPDDLKQFDSELDHKKRYSQLATAIAWLHDHTEVFHSSLFEELTTQNKIKFLTCHCDNRAVQRFDQVINQYQC
jgi:hypothetical protein